MLKRPVTLTSTKNSRLAMVGPVPRVFDYDTVRRLIERNLEFEKLFVARGLRHPHPEVRWRKKP